MGYRASGVGHRVWGQAGRRSDLYLCQTMATHLDTILATTRATVAAAKLRGAAVLSVLTDEPYFQGSLVNLERASAAVKLPCLRKDFMVDEYQIVEARAHRADAILLIVAALSGDELKRFSAAARGLGLDVLVEVHTADELALFLDAVGADGADAIGVNNRDLRSFEVRLETSLELVDRIPKSAVRVTESGISSADEMARLRAAGFDAFLIGESLMRQPDPGAALAELLEGAAALR